ncbi:MAG: molybdopterin-guanine dinucleotide biosynthesis protein B [Nitrososphaerales archaeon]
MTLFIAVFGKKKSGKTKTIETLIKELKGNLRIAVVKNVHHEDFTIDKPGKDSWRFTEAGAKKVLLVSPKEVVEIEKVEQRYSRDKILSRFREDSFDIVFLEGFYDIFSKDSKVEKMIVGLKEEEILELLKGCEGNVLACIITSNKETVKSLGSIPIYNLMKDKGKVIEDIMSLIKKIN